jgi:hypothetical protein
MEDATMISLKSHETFLTLFENALLKPEHDILTVSSILCVSRTAQLDIEIKEQEGSAPSLTSLS